VSFYCYQDVYGTIHDCKFPIGTAPEDVLLVSGRAVRNTQVELASQGKKKEFRGVQKGWPIESFTMGVHPDDRVAAMEDAAAHGVKTEYSPDGNPLLRNPSHARRFRKYAKAHDKDGFFG
jgi:hypothetical protein